MVNALDEGNQLAIAYVAEQFHPALGYAETYLSIELGRKHRIMMITSDRYSKRIFYPNRQILKQRRVGRGSSVERGIPTTRLGTILNLGFFETCVLGGLEKVIQAFNPDIVIANGVLKISTLRVALLKLRTRSFGLVVDDHMTYNASRGSWTKPLYRISSRIFIPILLRSADGFVAVTPETSQFMIKVYGIPSHRISVVPMGVNQDFFHPSQDNRDSCRQELGFLDKDVVFIYVGKIIATKGVHLFINAGLSLARNYHNTKFLVIGGANPHYLESLKNKISATGLSERFVFFDAIPNEKLPKFYNSADVGVWPLQCSVAMLEAAACGLPVLISDHSGAPERIENGNGLDYREGDENDLVGKMTLLMNPGLRQQMSKKATEFANGQGWSKVAIRFIGIANRRPKAGASDQQTPS